MQQLFIFKRIHYKSSIVYFTSHENCLFVLNCLIFCLVLYIFFLRAMVDVNMYERARSDSDQLRWENLNRFTIHMHIKHLTGKDKAKRTMKFKQKQAMCVSNTIEIKIQTISRFFCDFYAFAMRVCTVLFKVFAFVFGIRWAAVEQ